MNLLNNIAVDRVMNSVAAGTTVQNGTTVDMQDFDGVMFVAAFGALTATQVTSLKAQQGDQSDGSDGTDLTGSLVGPLDDADGNKVLVLDVYRPQKRYVRPVVNRATANAVIDGVTAFRYHGRKLPIAQGATVAASESHASPAEGTA